MYSPHPNPSKSPVPVCPVPADRTRLDLGRVLERRRAHRELDRLLGIDDPYPNVRLAYGLRSSLVEDS